MKVIRLSLKHIHHIVFSPIFSAAKICKIQTYPKKFPKTPKNKKKARPQFQTRVLLLPFCKHPKSKNPTRSLNSELQSLKTDPELLCS
jgi:hypothetical protein